VEVIVADQDNPTAILSAPTLVGFGKSFQLDGSKSFDVGGGKVTQYMWTYLGPAGSVTFPTGPVIAPTAPVIAPTAPVIAPIKPVIPEVGMAKFVLGQPVVTAVPNAVVDAGLPVGLHRFRLEVVTDTGQRSPPDEAVVEVQASTVAGAVLSPVLSPTVASMPTPVLSPSAIPSATTTSSTATLASTLPKSAPPSPHRRKAIAPRARKKRSNP